MELDEIDRKILDSLYKDSRSSYTSLAEKLGISDVAIKKRIDKLTEQGVIERFSISIDNRKLGLPLHAFILVKSIPSEAVQISEGLKRMKNVTRIFSVLGSYDIMVELACRDIDELKAVTDENIGNLRGVTEVRTLVVV
jgi:Lrp/AsnC family transcriptional regulator for asnA, asnC and gidA